MFYRSANTQAVRVEDIGFPDGSGSPFATITNNDTDTWLRGNTLPAWRNLFSLFPFS
jgi:hypothetical protein